MGAIGPGGGWRAAARGALAALALACAGCMTMIAGEEAEVQVLTAPPGAKVTTAHGQTISTPGVLRLRRDRNHVIQISHTGFRVAVVRVRSRHDPYGWAGSIGFNFLAWGWWSGGIGLVIGVVVDVVHGSVRELEPDTVFVPLIPAGEEAPLER